MRKRCLEVQPSQLYLSEKKVCQVREWFKTISPQDFQPLPVKEMEGRLFLTDGHTRAFVAYEAGWETIPLVLDEDDLNWTAYLTCVKAAEAAGVYSVADFKDRILSEEDYQQKWIDWCQSIF